MFFRIIKKDDLKLKCESLFLFGTKLLKLICFHHQVVTSSASCDIITLPFLYAKKERPTILEINGDILTYFNKFVLLVERE